jgi:hypothetical protein
MKRLRIRRIELIGCLLLGPIYFVVRGIIEGFTGTLLSNIVLFLLWWFISFCVLILCGWVVNIVVEFLFPGFRGEYGYHKEQQPVTSKKPEYAHVSGTISGTTEVRPDMMETDWMGRTPLHKAADKGDIQQIKLLIAKGEQVDAKDRFGFTPLHLAAERKYRDVVSLLIADGADINAQNDKGDTFLHSATSEGNQALCEFIIAVGADINARNNEGDTPLHCLAGAVYTLGMKREIGEPLLVDLAESLITNGGKVNAINNEGDTPLHIVAPSGWQDLIKLLLANGANVNIKNNEGQTPKVSIPY